MSPDSVVRLETAGAVATITLCRPEKRNAQTPRLWREIASIGASLGDDIRVAVIRAEGKSFSAGLDLAMLSPGDGSGDMTLRDMMALDDEAVVDQIAEFQEGFSWWRRADLVTIAAVQGHAIGAGFQLALACDLRVCADDVRFAMRETSLGLVPDLGGTHPLVSLVGYSRALEICVTGRFVEADEASQLGLATIVVPREQLDATVADLCAALTAPMHEAVTATKELLQGAARRTYDDQLLAERLAQVQRMRHLERFLPRGER